VLDECGMEETSVVKGAEVNTTHCC
jgi:hypothetical protein